MVASSLLLLPKFPTLIIIQQMWNRLIIQLSDEIANHTTEITDWIKLHEVETEEVRWVRGTQAELVPPRQTHKHNGNCR